MAMSRKTPTTLLSFGPTKVDKVKGELRFCVHKPLSYIDRNKVNPLAVSFFPEILNHDVIHCHQVFILLTEMVLNRTGNVGERMT